MPRRHTVLKDLLRQRHWQTYGTFCRQYDDAARRTDVTLVGHWPSRGQFARWLSGDIKGLPHPDHCRVLEAMFRGRTAQDLFAPAGAPLLQPEEQTEQETARGNAAAHPHVPLARRPPPGEPLPVAPAPTLRPARDPNAGGPPTAVRPFPGALQEEMAMTTEESARFVRGAQGGVDDEVLEQLRADVRYLAGEYVNRPPLSLFRPLSRLRAEVFELLDRRQRPAVLPPLYSVAGRLCALLAHASADLGHSYAAETHTRTAWLCADLADDHGLRAYVRWVQANVAFWDGDHRRAANLARSGQEHAPRGADLLRLASQEARAWAACGETAEVERALGVATQARDADERGDDDRDLVGVFRFEPGKAAYYASEARLALGGAGNARLAARDAHEALDLLEAAPEPSPEFVAAARLDLANAHLALTDLDGAADQLRTVLTLPVESRTQPIVGRVAQAGVTLRQREFTGSGLAQDLWEEIALFRAYSARIDLPEAD